MTAYRIGYVLLLALLLAADAFCGSWSTLALTALLILVPLVCLPLHLFAARRLRLHLDAPVNLEQGETGTLRVSLENGSALPLGLLVVRLELENLLNGQRAAHRVSLSARPRGTEQADCPFSAAHCGRVAIKAASLRVYDPFGLFGLRVRGEVLAHTSIQPRGFSQTILLTPDADRPEDSDLYAPDRPGDDLSEVYQLRDYRPGDSIRQVHWKLSSKLDRLVTREPSLPVQQSVLLFWERTQQATPAQTDAQADIAITACRALLSSGVRFTVAWNDAAEQRCVSLQISDMDELIGLLPRLLSAREAEGPSGAELLLRSAEALARSHILYLTGPVPQQAPHLARLGRLTVISCGSEAEDVLCVDAEHYPDQLASLTI